VKDQAGHVTQTIFSTALTAHPNIAKDLGFGTLKFADITRIWHELLRDDNGTMAGLRTALLDATACGEHPYDDVKQEPGGASAPNIVGMPRAELAQQITMARAQALIDRVNGRVPSR